MKNTEIIGTWDKLTSNMVHWKGWAVYYWDNGHKATLFQTKPKKHSVGIDIDPYFLKSCGINVAFDSDGDDYDTSEFYYGLESNGLGSHNPFRVTLTLPLPLLKQLKIVSI
jgi:hypothetical protein